MALISGGTVTPFATEKQASPAPKNSGRSFPSFIFLRLFLILLCLAATAQGIMIMDNAKSAMHEIEGYLAFLIAAIFFATASIIEALRQVAKN